jgi:hypothetical protein
MESCEKGHLRMTNYVALKPQVRQDKPTITTDHTRIDDLIEMLTYRRPSGSLSEQEFIRKFIMSVGAEPDGFGNFCLKIGDLPILWSCHTDTVHRYDGRQKLKISKDMMATLSDKNFMSNCLGADDGTGCWILREMILNNVPGYYVFHRGEEIGGVGSKWKSDNDDDVLDYDIAIAFDRMGYGDIINHQSTGKCASDEFTEGLAKELGSWWKPTRGLYTDTAEYIYLIPECTNLSVGYFYQHSERETQDLSYASWLRDKIISLDFNKLLGYINRDPYHEYKKKFDPPKIWTNNSEVDDVLGYDDYMACNYGRYNDNDAYYKKSSNDHDMEYFVEQYPKAIVDILEGLGLTVTDIKEYIDEIYYAGLKHH